MYHHHSQQQQGPPQPSSNRPGPTPHQQQQQNRFKYPHPSHLPDELVSTMATRGSGDIDHCLMELMNRLNPNQSSRPNPDQMSGTAGYSSNQLGHQQGMDWSNYPHPSEMFASPPSTVTQQSQSSPSAIGNQAWMQAPVYDPPSPQSRGSHGGGNGGGGVVDKQGLYTPERAESILATLGLSNEDLEFLSQYPEDQLNPDNLPFILRFIQTNKSKSQNSAASSSYSQSASRAIHDILPPPARSGRNTGRLRSPEVPRYHSVPQAAGKVIDYGHASQATDDSSGRESMPERRHARLQPFEPNKHVDLDYCRSGGEVHKNKRLSPAREFTPLYRSRHPDREYSRDGPRPSPSSETWNDSSSSTRDSRHPVLKSHGTTMGLPTPTMMCDFSAESPKVYPHTCSLCEVDCEHVKDWIEHVKSLQHSDSCRDLRNKYPEWKRKLLRREHSLGQDDSQTTWHTKERSRSMSRSPTPSSLSGKRRIPSAFAFSTPAGHSRRERSPVKDDSQTISLSHSWSPSPSPPPDKHRGGPHSQRQDRRSYQTPRTSYHRHHQAIGSSSRVGLKRPRDVSARHDDSARRKLPSSAKSPMKTKLKPGSKRTKPGSSKADDTSAKDPPAKKMKKEYTQSTPSCTPACLVYLTGIPTTATEQEVKTWVRDFGKYNNVVLLSGSEADQGQKASVCMEREEDALALAQCSSLSIGDQPITATLAKKPEADDSTAVSKGTSIQELSAIGGDDSGNGPELDKKTEEEFSSKSTVLITGLPESGWTESDVINLCQPFGAPSDIILATQLGKVLLLMPDAEMAEEMVKNHSVAPMKINDSELKMTNLEQAISLNTPVALYNLLNPTMSREARLVGWNRLLVIRNVPDTPTASSEVQKLVERIGTVHNILVLNHNMILCEMLTAGVGVRIRNHYNRFPCIIQSNPLYFTAWRDPIDQNLVWGPHWLTPWLTASLDSLKESPDDDKDEKDGKRHEMLSSQNEEYVEEVNKNINLRRFYCHLCKCYINDLKSKILHLKGRKHVASLIEKKSLDSKRARKAKKGKLRDETGEKTSSKDDAAGKAASKERKREDQQDIKVGEELSDAAPTQVEAYVKTDKIKLSPSKQRKEGKTINTSREKLDKISSGPRETKSSSSAAGDGEASSSNPAHLKLPKVELEEDQFQDFPDLQDFVTVDEVGDVNDFPSSPPPGAVAMDTTVMVDKESPADDKDSHTVPTADKEDSTPQENDTSVPGEKKKTVKMDNRNAEGDAKSSGEDKYFEEIYLNGRDRLHCKLCNGIFLEEAKEEHLKGRRHKMSLQLLGQKCETDEYLEEFCNRRGQVNLHCKLCKCNIGLSNQENHLKTKTHRRLLELKRDFDAKMLKEGELRDDTDEKTSSKDEAAGKGQSKDQQDIKESPDDDKDSHIVLTPQQNGTYDHLVDICYDGTAIDFFCTLCESQLKSRDAKFVDSHLNEKMHKMLQSLSLYRGEKRDKIEILSEDKCIVEVNGKSTMLYCSVCKCKVPSKFYNGHLKGKQHIASLWERMKDGKLKDETDENTSTKDEAAGKQLRKDQQDIKVGEELSNAAPTQVCNPEADVKTDNAISLQLLVENSKLDEYVEEVHNRDGRVVLLSCKLCKCSIKVNAKDEHLKSERHARRLELECKEKLDTWEKKPTSGQLRDNTEEKINSNAALTQVCNPEADAKTVKIKMSLATQPEERNSSPEELDKINSGPKETKSSSSAAGDGEDSSCKPAHLELPKVESEEDQFQDFPFDMTDFVTVDEVGDVNDITGPPPPPPDAVTTDTTATVKEAGDESDLPACPPPPAVVPMDSVTSEAVVMVKSTEEERESEAEATPVPEDTPRGSPGPLTLATAAPETFETTATASGSPTCVEPTLDPVVAAEQHPHSPVPPEAMCSSDQLDTPVPLPVAANMDSTLADDSLPASAPAATTPDLEAGSSGVTPTAGGEQENQGPVSHSPAEEEVTEKVEQVEDEEDKGKTAASVSVKRRIPEEKEEEPMQKKQKTHGTTADNPPPPPPCDPNSAVGMEFLVPKKGFFCKLCNRFFTGGRESELNHCKSQKHHENWQKYLKSKKTTSR